MTSTTYILKMWKIQNVQGQESYISSVGIKKPLDSFSLKILNFSSYTSANIHTVVCNITGNHHMQPYAT